MKPRHTLKAVPRLLQIYGIEEPIPEVICGLCFSRFNKNLNHFSINSQVRANLRRQFVKYGKEKLDPQAANMLIFRGQVGCISVMN